MEDIAAKIADLLGNDDSMKQMAGILSSLGGSPGGDGQAQEASGGGLDLGSLLGMLGAMGGGTGPGDPQEPSGGPRTPGNEGGGPQNAFSGPGEGGGGLGLDPKMLGLIARAMRMMNEPDPNVELLKALKPYLEGSRRDKVDEAVKVMRLLRLVPLLQESGLFPGKE